MVAQKKTKASKFLTVPTRPIPIDRDRSVAGLLEKMEGAGFGGDTNIVTIITKDRDEQLGKMSKEDTAAEILDRILSFREGQEKNDISD